MTFKSFLDRRHYGILDLEFELYEKVMKRRDIPPASHFTNHVPSQGEGHQSASLHLRRLMESEIPKFYFKSRIFGLSDSGFYVWSQVLRVRQASHGHHSVFSVTDL